jgi:hypothetical protein
MHLQLEDLELAPSRTPSSASSSSSRLGFGKKYFIKRKITHRKRANKKPRTSRK